MSSAWRKRATFRRPGGRGGQRARMKSTWASGSLWGEGRGGQAIGGDLLPGGLEEEVEGGVGGASPAAYAELHRRKYGVPPLSPPSLSVSVWGNGRLGCQKSPICPQFFPPTYPQVFDLPPAVTMDAQRDAFLRVSSLPRAYAHAQRLSTSLNYAQRLTLRLGLI